MDFIQVLRDTMGDTLLDIDGSFVELTCNLDLTVAFILLVAVLDEVADFIEGLVVEALSNYVDGVFISTSVRVE